MNLRKLWMLPLVTIVVSGPSVLVAGNSLMTLKTDDTILEVEVRGDRLYVSGLKSAGARANWTGSSEQSLIGVVETDSSSLPVNWRFKKLTRSTGHPVQAEFVFESESPALELQSVWTAFPGPGPVEHQIRITNKGKLPFLLPLQHSLMLDAHVEPGHALENFWVEKGSGTPGGKGVHQTKIGAEFSASLISLPYSDEPRDAIPWTAIYDSTYHRGLYFGIEFSGRVQINLRALKEGNEVFGVHSVLGLDARTPFTTRLLPGGIFETPTAFIGCYKGDLDDGANRLHRWIESHLRPPINDKRYPLLVNNSWGSGMAVNERLANRMIDESSRLGVELFHIDAGWFRGVGDWEPDEKKFPHGLAAIADIAHAKGLKFGLWVGWTQGGHQITNLINESVLRVFDPAMKNWFVRDYPPDWRTQDFTGADVCLGEEKAREWCLQKLRHVVETNHLDLLEHDQRMIVDSCIRQDHLHTSSKADIAYHAARGYYQVYDSLRAEYPNLLFENCVNGGRMIDFGVVKRTHYISITDTYDPLSNRRAFFDASYALPPSMCECYIENRAGTNTANFRYMLRSGMMGWCTLMLDMSKWNADQQEIARRQFALYKTELRPFIAHGNLYHVSERPDGVHWDGMQYTDPKSKKAVLFAFRGTTKDSAHTFNLKGLTPQKRYELTFEDETGKSIIRTGADLMTNGITITLPDPESSELVFIRSK